MEFYSNILDKNYNKLEVGDEVLLFGERGIVSFDSGAYGILFEKGVPWDLIKSKIPERISDNDIQKSKTFHFCYCDYFVSFLELILNFRCCIEDVCEVVEKVKNYT